MTSARISRVWRTIMLTITICSFSFPAYAKYSGGTGDPDDPYQIATAADLMLLGESPEDYDKHFILTADIDLSGYSYDRAVIAPDTNDVEGGFQGIPFTGVFDGNGHAISHLTISGDSYLGLFGQTGPEAKISNVGLEAVDVTGGGGSLVSGNWGTITSCYSTGSVTGGGLVGSNLGTITSSYSTASVTGGGGLVGANYGSITMSYSTGSVTGEGWSVGGLVGGNLGIIMWCYSTGSVSGDGSQRGVGGLVGWNDDSSIISSYSTGTVSGDHNVGGLVGCNGDSSIISSYSTGSVSGDRNVGGLAGSSYGNITMSYSTGVVTGNDEVGGLVGWNDGRITMSFWDMEASGSSISDGGIGLTTAEMMDPYMLGLNGFANDPNWIMDADRDYPRLAWEGTAGDVIPEPDIDWMEGDGTAQNPYLIDTTDQFTFLIEKTSNLWDRHFVLRTDLDLNPNLPNVPVFTQAPIPVFSGFFHGNDHTISHLTITGGNFLGLFGRLEYEAAISNLGVEDVDVSGTGHHVGGLVGYNIHGSITSSYSTGKVSGTDRVGGLVGSNGGGRITTSYSTAMVTGNDNVGGLVGDNHKHISTSYSTGTVSGDHDVGGLVGYNYLGDISMSYSTGWVSGSEHVGGLVGVNNRGLITLNYSTGVVAGVSCFGGLVGFSEDLSITSLSFWDMETSGQVESAGGTGKTTDEMQTASTFLEAGWDFIDETENGTDDVWWILEGQDYPRLWWELVSKN